MQHQPLLLLSDHNQITCATGQMCVFHIQWDSYNVDTLRNGKHVLIIGVSSFQGGVYISRIGQINH